MQDTPPTSGCRKRSPLYLRRIPLRFGDWPLLVHARYYNPTLGRFLQTDPIDTQGGNNLYAYVGNDPINLADPTGLCAQSAMVSDTQSISGAVPGYPETGATSWRASNDAIFIQSVENYNDLNNFSPGDPGYWTADQLKAQAMIESGGSQRAFTTDPLQVNNSGDWVPEKTTITGLQQGQAMDPQTSADAALNWMEYKGWVQNADGDPVQYRGDYQTLLRYNGNTRVYPNQGGVPHDVWYANTILQLTQQMSSGGGK